MAGKKEVSQNSPYRELNTVWMLINTKLQQGIYEPQLLHLQDINHTHCEFKESKKVSLGEK